MSETDSSVSFHVSRVGTPVLVKVSYFPNWHASGADGPWRVTPNLMVVVPTSHDVTLSYGRSSADDLGQLATLVGLVALVGLFVVALGSPPGCGAGQECRPRLTRASSLVACGLDPMLHRTDTICLICARNDGIAVARRPGAATAGSSSSGRSGRPRNASSPPRSASSGGAACGGSGCKRSPRRPASPGAPCTATSRARTTCWPRPPTTTRSLHRRARAVLAVGAVAAGPDRRLHGLRLRLHPHPPLPPALRVRVRASS